MQNHDSHRRPIPQVPEPIEFDPFEMDWPWPGMQQADPEAAAPDPAAEAPDEQAVRVTRPEEDG